MQVLGGEMSDNDYSHRQAEKNQRYVGCYHSPEVRAWIESLTPEQRRQAEADGLLAPMMDRSGSTMRDEDAAEMADASVTPDIAAALDVPPPQDSPAAANAEGDVRGDILASFCARMRGCANPALVFDAVCYGTGVLAMEGKTATELAAQHGVTKQAFSKIAVLWCETFGLPPARAMKSKRARKAYRERAERVHEEREQRKLTRARKA